jgi:RNA polymerase sigma-70 factor (ECF subfamily)
MSASSVPHISIQHRGAVTVGQGRARPANDCAPAPVGDRLEPLYRTHRAAIDARCRRLLQNRESAEDATHETFLRVARNLGKVPPSGDEALRWIYRVATNYCLNLLRDQRRTVPAGAELRGPGDDAAPSEDSIDRDLLRRILAGVPAKTQTVAVLRHVDGLYEHEVADLLGVSRRTVTYRLAEFRRRALDNFKRDQRADELGRKKSAARPPVGGVPV